MIYYNTQTIADDLEIENAYRWVGVWSRDKNTTINAGVK